MFGNYIRPEPFKLERIWLNMEFKKIELPEIVTYEEIASYLRLSRKAIYQMVHRNELKKGIYLGRGRFNMSKLRYCIDQHGTHLSLKEQQK
jgi:excisionase family DNA binding protein